MRFDKKHLTTHRLSYIIQVSNKTISSPGERVSVVSLGLFEDTKAWRFFIGKDEKTDEKHKQHKRIERIYKIRVGKRDSNDRS